MMVFGAALCALPFLYGVHGTGRTVDLVAGVGVIVTAAVYLASPTWRSYVVVDTQGLRVMGPRGERMRLDWNDVVEVIADEEERAALVRGPAGKQSFLVPSTAHPAPYRIDEGLYAELVKHAPADKVRRSKEFR
jgi:hypothetical protein